VSEVSVVYSRLDNDLNLSNIPAFLRKSPLGSLPPVLLAPRNRVLPH
jgi:hypothetical protein